MNDIKQFKLTSGEEVVCDVVEWPDDDMSDLVVRHAYKVFVHAETGDGTRIYSMRPWMLLQDEQDSLQIINGNHIVGETAPSKKMLEQYVKIINNTEAEQQLSADDLAAKLADHINNLRKSIIPTNDDDSDNDNVISFPTGRTFH